MYMCIYIQYIYIGGLMEYISQKVAICSIWTVCPFIVYPPERSENSVFRHATDIVLFSMSDNKVKNQ